MKYWLMKTEPSSFSIQTLEDSPGKITHWDGVRNYQARNTMRDDMKLGDRVLIYHSNAKPTAVVGIAEVVRESYPDHLSWDESDHHYDPKSTPENPRWFMVDVKHIETFKEPIAREDLKEVAALKDMELLRKGSRLSVQPVRKKEYDAIIKIAQKQS